MKKTLVSIFTVIGMVSSPIFLSDAIAQKITKCQDENGKWHYGTSNAYLCADSSKITTLDKRGVKVDEVAALKTQEELDLEKKAEEDELKRLEEQKFENAERDRILMVYQSEEDVERSRTNQVKSLEQKKAQHQNYIVSLKKQIDSLEKKKAKTKLKGLIKKSDAKIELIKPKIQKSEERIIQIDQSIVDTNNRFNEDLAFFKKHKNKLN